MTAVFNEVYLGTRNVELEQEARAHRYSLYLLCDVDTPFHADKLGLRREEARQKMHQRYADYVRSTGSPCRSSKSCANASSAGVVRP